MAKYESIFIVNPELGEEGIQAVVGKFKSLIETSATVIDFAEWGKRRLAYPIDDINDGYYVCTQFTAEPTFPAELERIYKITDGILRFLVVKIEE
ncbi:MAG: 30S ribosomal protein S6 [Ruminococcaceae bacterium]|nr:30S ribosomal protein S6 [Oscillospiraceae bacterium]